MHSAAGNYSAAANYHHMIGVAALVARRAENFKTLLKNNKDFLSFQGLKADAHHTITQSVYKRAKDIIVKEFNDFSTKPLSRKGEVLESIRRAVSDGVSFSRRKYAKTMKLKFDKEDEKLAPYLQDFFVTDTKGEYPYWFMLEEFTRVAGQGLDRNPHGDNKTRQKDVFGNEGEKSLAEYVIKHYVYLFMLYITQKRDKEFPPFFNEYIKTIDTFNFIACCACVYKLDFGNYDLRVKLGAAINGADTAHLKGKERFRYIVRNVKVTALERATDAAAARAAARARRSGRNSFA